MEALLRLRCLDAGAFTFVMATGIVSEAAAEQRLVVLSQALFAVAAAAWVVLAAVVLLRAIRGAPRPRPASFAVVAATAVVGVRSLDVGATTPALGLWALAVACWIGLALARPAVGEPRGSTLLVPVATESLAVLATPLAQRFGLLLERVALAFWLLGLALYPVVVVAIGRALRRSRAFRPDLWVVMGCLAIATLAAAQLAVDGAGRWVREAAVATWVVATAWIVPLLVAELRRADWRYDGARWAFVFPLGMYGVACEALARAEGLAALRRVAVAALAVALVAWTLTVLGLLRTASVHAGSKR